MFPEEASGHTGEGGGHPGPLGEIFRCRDRTGFRDRHGQAASTESQVQELGDATAALGHQVRPGHAQIRGAVGDVLRDVGGPDEDRLEVRSQLGHQGPFGGELRPEAGGLEEVEGLLGETAFVGKCDAKHVGLPAFVRAEEPSLRSRPGRAYPPGTKKRRDP
jgi:hypothetical protein